MGYNVGPGQVRYRCIGRTVLPLKAENVLCLHDNFSGLNERVDWETVRAHIMYVGPLAIAAGMLHSLCAFDSNIWPNRRQSMQGTSNQFLGPWYYCVRWSLRNNHMLLGAAGCQPFSSFAKRCRSVSIAICSLHLHDRKKVWGQRLRLSHGPALRVILIHLCLNTVTRSVRITNHNGVYNVIGLIIPAVQCARTNLCARVHVLWLRKCSPNGMKCNHRTESIVRVDNQTQKQIGLLGYCRLVTQLRTGPRQRSATGMM